MSENRQNGEAADGVVVTPILNRSQWLELRKPLITASVAAALFGDGVHPYHTAYGLWALKSGLVDEDPTETPSMRRGRLLEPVALDLIAEEFPDWRINPCLGFYADPVSRIGATPDAFATRPDIEGLGVVQIKTVGHFAFKKGWRGMDGDVEIPLWVAVQASVEAALTGASWAAVAAMSLGDGGLDLYVEDVPLRPALMAKLRVLAVDFWRRVETGDSYPPDFNRDSAAIARIYSDADNGVQIDLSGDLRVAEIIEEREKLKAREADGAKAEKSRKVLDAELIYKMGNAARGELADGRIIEAPTTNRKAYEVKASSYRTVKIKERK